MMLAAILVAISLAIAAGILSYLILYIVADDIDGHDRMYEHHPEDQP